MWGCTERLFAVTGSWLTAGSTAAELPRAGGLQDFGGMEDMGMGSLGDSPGKGTAGKRAGKGFLLKLWG